MPVIRVKKRRASLRRLLRTKYASVEEEKAAVQQWAHSQTSLWHAEALGRYARIGLPDIAFRYWAIFFLLYGLALIGMSTTTPAIRISVGLFLGPTSVVSVIGLLRMLPIWLKYLLHPRAARAALWLAWLGNVYAFPYLFYALRLRPLTEGQRAWRIEVENALTELIDQLPPGTYIGAGRKGLEDILKRDYFSRKANTAEDFTASRAYLLAAIVRYLYAEHLLGDGLQVLERVLDTPADSVQTPNRYLVREVASLYQPYSSQGPTTTALPAPLRVASSIKTLTLLRRRP